MYLGLLLLSVPAVLGLQCFHCGPYLTASSQQCKGQPKAVDCTASKGCVYNHARREDGTFFVEKRCSFLEENNQVDGQCSESIFDGIAGTQCFCTGDLCNSATVTSISTWILSFLTILLLGLLH